MLPWSGLAALAFVSLACAGPARRGLQRYRQHRRIHSWRLDSGSITFARVSIAPQWKSSDVPATITIDYIYRVSGEQHTGSYSRVMSGWAEADRFVEGLTGCPVQVRYDPLHPANSALSESSLADLVQDRDFDSALTPPQPSETTRPILQGMAVLAAAGLIVTLCLNLGAIVGFADLPETLLLVLHLGIFVLALAGGAVSLATGYRSRWSKRWDIFLDPGPHWVHRLPRSLFAYAVINALITVLTAIDRSLTAPDGLCVVSAFWMAIYATLLANFTRTVGQRFTARRIIKAGLIMLNEYIEQRAGGYYIAGTRISLDSIVYSFNEGQSPEAILEDFPSLKRAQIYGAIAFYLDHQTEIDQHLAVTRQEFEGCSTPLEQANRGLWVKIQQAKAEAAQEGRS